MDEEIKEDDELLVDLPIEEKCQHKKWSVRVKGYEDAAKLFKEAEPGTLDDIKYAKLVHSFIGDSNIIAREKGIEAALAFVKYCGYARKICIDLVRGVVSLGLVTRRPKTRELSVELILMYVEIQMHKPVEDELIKAMDSKSPKIVSSCIFVLREALRSFGAQVISLDPILINLPKLLKERDKSVRDEAKQLCVEVYRWAGDAVREEVVKNLEPITLSELETHFQKVKDDPVVPIRNLRSRKKTLKLLRQESSEVVTVTEEQAPPVEETDFSLLVPTDLLADLPPTFYSKCEAEKWQHRKEALESLYKMSNNVRLNDGDYRQLVTTLSNMIANDTNITVVRLATNCLSNLILGLRENFRPYYSKCVSVLLSRFKEKKDNVVQALRDAMDAIYTVAHLGNLVPDIQSAFSSDNPQVKSETAAFLARSFTKCTASDISMKLVPLLCEPLIKILNHPSGKVRENSAKALGTMMKILGEEALSPYLEEVSAAKMAKVKEFCEKADISESPQKLENVQLTSTPLPALEYSTLSETQPETSNLAVPELIPKVENLSLAEEMNSTFTVKLETPDIEGNSSINKSAQEESQSSEEEYSIVVSSTGLPDDVISGLQESGLKKRREAFEKLAELVQNADIGTVAAHGIINLLCKFGAREKNAKMIQKRLEVLSFLAHMSLAPDAVDTCLNEIVPMIGHAVHGESAKASLTSLVSTSDFRSIAKKAMDMAFSLRNQSIRCGVLIWINEMIEKFGFKVDVEDVIEHLKELMSSRNSAAKSAARALLQTLFEHSGEKLRKSLNDDLRSLLQLQDTS